MATKQALIQSIRDKYSARAKALRSELFARRIMLEMYMSPPPQCEEEGSWMGYQAECKKAYIEYLESEYEDAQVWATEEGATRRVEMSIELDGLVVD